MKKLLYSISLMTIICFCCISCSDENETNNYPKDLKSNIPEQFQKIGEIHNLGLEYAFDSLRSYYSEKKTRSKKSSVKKLSKKDVKVLMSKAVTSFTEKNLQNFNKKTTKGYSNEIIASLNKDSLIQTNSLFNPKISLYLEKIKEILKHEPKSPEQLLYKLNEINNEAKTVLSEQEMVAIYAGTSTCYNSYIYWKKNYLKWNLTLKHPNIAAKYTNEQIDQLVIKNGKIVPLKATKSDDKDKNWWDSISDWADETWDNICDDFSDWWEEDGGKEVVAADAGDAVAGAIGGALAGSSAGGIGALPGAVVGAIGGGTTGSVSEAIQQWMTND